jgi:hypothetical protein
VLPGANGTDFQSSGLRHTRPSRVHFPQTFAFNSSTLKQKAQYLNVERLSLHPHTTLDVGLQQCQLSSTLTKYVYDISDQQNSHLTDQALESCLLNLGYSCQFPALEERQLPRHGTS